MVSSTDRLQLFPDTTKIEDDSLSIAGRSLGALAEAYGTPLYIYDRATMDADAARYKAALKAQYSASSSITYAGKAFLCKAIAQWARQRHLWMDCTGEGEMAIALAGGLEPASIVVHGSNKLLSDLRAAWQSAGTIVVDNLGELEHLGDLLNTGASVSQTGQRPPNIWLRLQPGVVIATHHVHTQTGQLDSKFGMTPDELMKAAQLARHMGLWLNGLHFHLGSNFRDTAALSSAIEIALDLVPGMGFPDTWHFCPGGGWSVAYHEDELPQPDPDLYVRVISQGISKRCRARGLSLPMLHIEPGRSLVARAGVALYRVGGIKKRGKRTWLLIDGGMADNLRHALYGSKYSCLPIAGLARPMSEQVSIAGPYCESGDVLIEDLRMPKIEEGEVLAVPVSGAYHLSMSSNYNGARRPAAVWLENGAARLMMRRETVDELMQRDLSIT